MRPTSVCLLAFATLSLSPAQMVSGSDMPGFKEAFGTVADRAAKDLEIVQTFSSAGTNVFWPGERVELGFELKNRASVARKLVGRASLVAYSTSIPLGDIWTPHVRRLGETPGPGVSVELPANGAAQIRVTLPAPARFGGYGVVLDFGKDGRAFATSISRVMKARPGREWLPSYAIDMPWPHEMSPNVTQTFYKLGVKGCRMGVGYTPTWHSDFESDLKFIGQHLDWSKQANIVVMLTIGAGKAPQPLDRGRPWLNADNTLIEGIKEDLAWLEKHDGDFRKYVAELLRRYGWPKGPVNAVELWNEPWEGVSISGWGADTPRYRDMYRQMALGVMDARAKYGVKVLIGGASSSSNTLDKLFSDGKDTFLPMLDFVSIHYQGTMVTPALIPSWMDRKGDYGRVQVWDTESWVANSDDRIAGVVASMRSFGQDRAMGTYGGNVYGALIQQAGGKEVKPIIAWSASAAVAAAANFVGPRRYEGMVFKNGLPWVYRFAEPARPEDGTIVVVGDLTRLYTPHSVLFYRTQQAIAPSGGMLTIDNAPSIRVFDFSGNPVPERGAKIRIPLNGNGYYLRTDGSKGSFAKLAAVIARGTIEGVPPVEITPKDLLAVPTGSAPARFRVNVHNVLNRPVTGTLRGTLAGVAVTAPAVTVPPNQAVEVEVTARVPARGANLYPCDLAFGDARTGIAKVKDTLRANVIERRSPKIDGDLSDWAGVPPQRLTGEGIGATLTETAWLPFRDHVKAGGAGLATGWIVADDRGVSFAARVVDPTPSDGTVRFATRDDDRYFYPAAAYQVKDGRKELVWPEGERRFSYRRDPDLPSGNGTDNVQLAFNILPPSQKMWRDRAPLAPLGYVQGPDTDYEFALNTVAPEFGGGTELLCLLRPGMPRKHGYPRQPKAAIDIAPVPGAELVTRRVGDDRLTEAFIPWATMPEVERAYRAGGTVKFTFRVNNDKGPSLELAENRSVSRANSLTFHNDWTGHWGNQLEFRFAR